MRYNEKFIKEAYKKVPMYMRLPVKADDIAFEELPVIDKNYDAISKLEQGQEITPEESKVINWEYEELELTLPTDKVEWKKMIKEGKRGIGIGYRRSLQSDSNFCF